MPLVEIRPVVQKEIPSLIKLNHSSESLYVWQMDNSVDRGQIELRFHETRLPRPSKLDYPRNPEKLETAWQDYDLFLTARMDDQLVGYLTMDVSNNNNIGHVLDLVVDEPARRKGIATAMLVSAQDWLRVKKVFKIMLEIQTRNHPTILFAQKMRYEFSGFMDCYFNNRDLALFFSANLK